MSQQFSPIITGDQSIDRLQQNISNSLNPSNNSGLSIVNTNKYVFPAGVLLLVIPTSSIAMAANGVTIILPDAVKNPGISFSFKKTDTSSNSINFISISKNRQGNNQTVENAASYSTSASLASGVLFSDGSNWWLI